MTIRVAFTGTGFISKVHALAAQRVKEVELAAVVNHRQESMKEFAKVFNIPRQYTTVEQLFTEDKVDALVVGTPNYLHASQTIAALQAGVHVMVEKPMAMNAQEAEQMVAASQKSGASLMVAHCWRFDPEVIWLRSQVASGILGRIVRTKGYGVHVNWGPKDWFVQRKYAGGGALLDMGIHAIDTARFLLGDPQPRRVYAQIGSFYGNYDVDDTGLVIVEWDGGIISYIESGWWQPHADGPEAATQLYGTSGFGRLFPSFLSVVNLERGEVKKIESGFSHPRQPHCPQSMYDTQFAYFIEAIRSHTSPKPGGEEGWVNMRIIDAAYQSARLGTAVDL